MVERQFVAVPDGLLPLGLADLGLLVPLGHDLSQGGPSDGPLELDGTAGALLGHLFLLRKKRHDKDFSFFVGRHHESPSASRRSQINLYLLYEISSDTMFRLVNMWCHFANAVNISQ